MRFVVTGEWNRNQLLRLILFFFLVYILMFWVTNWILYFEKMSLDPASVVSYYLGDTEADFGKRDFACEQTVERLTGDEAHNLALWSRFPELGNNVGVQQPPGHSFTPRTGMRTAADSIVRSRSGESRMSLTRSSPERSPLRR